MLKRQIRPEQIVRWMAALVTLALAVALCAGCLELYQAGSAPENLTPEGVHITPVFTREKVGAKLAQIAPTVICWVILLVLAATQPREPEKRLPIDPENALRLMRPRVEETAQMKNERQWRDFVGKFAIGILFVCWYFIHKHVSDRAAFTSWDLEQVMADMLRSTWVPSLIAVAVMCLWAWWEGRSYAAEWKAACQAPRRELPLPERTPAPFLARARRYGVPAMRIMLAVAAVALIVLGVLNGGMYDVLVKAINICTECIGLG